MSFFFYSAINKAICKTANFNSSSKIQIEESWLSEDSWVWKAVIPEPKAEIISQENYNECKITLGDLHTDSHIGYPALPRYIKIFNALPEEIKIEVKEQNKRTFNLPANIEIFRDYPITGYSFDKFSDDFDTDKFEWTESYPEKRVKVSFIGYKSGVPLTKVVIFPYLILSDGHTLNYFEELTVSVHIDRTTNLVEDSRLSSDPVLKALNLSETVIRRRRKEGFSKPQFDILIGKDLMRIVVEIDGIYRISKKCLADSGASIKGVDPRTFRLFNKGYEIPIYVAGESDGVFNKNDYVEFIGQRNRNSVADYEHDPFTDKNIYWITWGEENGLRYADESTKPTVESNQAIVPHDYLYAMHIEENNHFDRLGRVDVDLPSYTRDHWFFDSGINGGTTKSYSFQIPYPNTNTVKSFDIEVGMHGITYPSEHSTAKHDITVHINNIQAAIGTWIGQTPHIIKNIPSQVLQNKFLKHKENKIQITVAGDDPTNRYDKVLLDWYKIHYYRLYKAYNDFIDFYPLKGIQDGLYHFTIDNFSNPDISVYKVGKSKLRDFEINYNRSMKTYSIVIEDYVHNDSTLYYAASSEGIKVPISIEPDTIFGLKSSNEETDVLIITTQKWKYSLDKLVEFYREIGYDSKVVSIQDINNEFNFGIVSPYALKKFLKYLYYNWEPVPEYVLIIGDANIREEESVPSFFFQTYKFGASACDHWFTLVDEYSDVPEFAIGRWPCSTDEELETLIEKRINYKNKELIDPWKNELLFIAGKEEVFKNQSENMIKRQISKEFGINRIYINPSSRQTPFWGGSDTLIYLFNNGLVLTNFMGHGGGAVWADRSLFNTSHIPLLDNLDRLPFLTSMTCFTGDFTNVTGLGEHVLLAENGGAIGLWGASSIGWIKNDYLIDKPFYDFIFKPEMTVGKAIQIAKVKYLTEQDYFDHLRLSMVHMYNLIGDPTVKLPFPDKKATLSIDEENPASGDTVTLAGELPFYEDEEGEIFIQLYDLNRYRLLKNTIIEPFSGQNFSYQLTLPDDIIPGESFINYYLRSSDGTKDAHGATLFSIKGLSFYGFECNPRMPHKNEEFTVSINTNIKNIQSLICEIDTTYASEYLDDNGIEHVVSFQDTNSIIKKQMIPCEGNVAQWQLENPFKVMTPGKLIAVRFVAFDTLKSPIYSIRIKQEPDIYPVKIEQGGTRFPELNVTMNYIGDDTLDINARVYHKISESADTLFGDLSFEILPDRNVTFRVPGILGRRFETFKVIIDPANTVSESNEINNELIDSIFVKTFPLLPGVGTTYNGVDHDTLCFEGIFSLSIHPDGIVDSSVIVVDIDTITGISNQPDFELISPSSDYSKMSFDLSLCSPISVNGVWVSINANDLTDTELNNVSIGRRNPLLQIWIKEKTASVEKILSTGTSTLGKFSLLRCNDNKPPMLELNLEGQRFFQNSYVSQKPNISIIGEDDNGVKFDSSGIEVILNDDRVAFSSLSIPDTVVGGSYVSARFRPELDWGEHFIEVSLSDAAGNISTERIDFIVSDKLRLIDYGNFPNPFKDRTVFIYELTQRVETLQIKIYTLSGRLIKVLDNESIFSTDIDMNEGGYHEVIWHGLDEYGNFVANGVYFYKIYAKRGGKVSSSIGKIAKAR
ncbi:MAG: hypothetical protein ISS81_05810 [Candidatus Marinimicrobia bacterium]|nr:hypothetical protein [Candidatus Neomarinimicrobiota bacterium]